jgi:hypothetical protein
LQQQLTGGGLDICLQVFYLLYFFLFRGFFLLTGILFMIKDISMSFSYFVLFSQLWVYIGHAGGLFVPLAHGWTKCGHLFK